MAAPTNAAKREKALANTEPSTHGTSRQFAALQDLITIRAITDIEQAARINREDEPCAHVCRSIPADDREIFPLGPGLRCVYPGYGSLQLADGRAGFARVARA